jgi:tape measure domain-containing protein
MKLNSEQAKGAMLALGQMASKGTVQAEELRGQLGERIPGAFGIAARSMGVTESKLNDMLQKGEVAAKDFLPRFAAEMQKTFGEDALRNANGPAAIQARFDNAIFKMKTTIGEGLMPLITPVIQTMTAFAQNILPPIQAGIQFLVDGLASITSGTSAWSGWFEVVQQISVRVFGFVKNILGTVYNIVSGIVSWVAKSQILQDVFWVIGKVVSGVMSVVEWIANKLLWVWDNVLRPVLEKIEWVYSKVKGLFDGGKKEIVVTAGTAEGLNAAKIPGGTLVLPPDTKGPKAVTPLSGTSNITPGTNQVPTTQTKEKAAAINGGGQRSITITIGKMIEKVEMRVVEGGKMAAEDLGSLVRGEILKVFNQIEATGA